MSDDVTVVWVEPGDSAQSSHEGAARALAGWARARGVRLQTIDPAPAPEPTRDDTVAERVERELDHAREALGGADTDAVEHALARAEGLLRAHPELPQAAWLRAEVSRAWSTRYLRLTPRDDARARSAWEAAEAIDGGRAAGIGETAFPPRARRTSTLVVAGARARADVLVWIDGRALARATRTDERGLVFETELAEAEHQVAIAVDGRPVFASWIATSSGADPPLRIEVSERSCTPEAFATVRREGDLVRPGAASCPRWVAAVPGERSGSVLVARCEEDRCGPFLEWRTETISPSLPPQEHDRSRPWPRWATITIMGVAVVAASTVALVASGVFESRPVEQRFVVGAARQE